MSVDANRVEDSASRGMTTSTVESVIQQLALRIEERVWREGERLPSVRALAQAFEVSPVTMAKAVKQLCALGILRSEPRKGVYVAIRTSPLPSDVGYEVQRTFIRQFVNNRMRTISIMPLDTTETINLASGTMAPDAVPNTAIQTAIRDTASVYEEKAISSIPIEGDERLREWVCSHLTRFGVQARSDEVIITNGSQQGRKVLADTLIDPGDTILIEQPTYHGALSVFEAAGARCIGVPIDLTSGPRLDVLEMLAEHYRPKFFYTIPTGQIPTGLTISAESRRRIIELAIRKRFLIVESDPGNEIFYDGNPPSAIKSQDPGGVVVYLKSFSRIVAAGLRIGAVIVSDPLREAMINRKVVDDAFTSTLTQHVFNTYVTQPDFEQNILAARAHYKIRRDATMNALQKFMPDGVTWTIPTSGMHTWLTLPHGLSSRLIAEHALNKGVAVAHSEIFMPNNYPDQGIRITFSDNDPERIELGIQRLANTISSWLDSKDTRMLNEYVLKVL